MLTGKCKDDFEKWYYNTWLEDADRQRVGEDWKLHLWAAEPIYLNALIVAFFDSVGIYINIINLDLQGWFYYKVIHLENFEDKILYRTRTEATISAIKKADEIYNNKLGNFVQK